MSRSFRERWNALRINDVLPGLVLQPRLAALVLGPLIRVDGCLLFQALAVNSTGADAFQDRTGYEAFVNKIHIEDYIDAATSEEEMLPSLIRQGVKAATELAERLEADGRFRILLSLDPELPTLTMRFFQRRQGEPWGADEPDEFRLEEVLMIDTD